MKKLVTLALVGLAASSLVISSAVVQETAIAQQPSIRSVNPNVALDGNWRLQWRVSGINHQARLSMNGNYGRMIVNARMPNGRVINAEQRMTLTPTRDGFILRGSRPTYPGTNRRVPNYNPDTFRIQPVGRNQLRVTNCSSGVCVPVNMRRI
ncbi:hypothetical protein ACE1B6_07915 [Aerosakkonemataceae cyanobacterium BLCC-F154]|uniref:Uncharacterized protein n=1 Tax=Floridaenema fluviatile BLCC-F154 TaxID=3153640 RepID=A0ABV4YBB4_9CYAN